MNHEKRGTFAFSQEKEKKVYLRVCVSVAVQGNMHDISCILFVLP